jgi:hypothetical protein
MRVEKGYRGSVPCARRRFRLDLSWYSTHTGTCPAQFRKGSTLQSLGWELFLPPRHPSIGGGIAHEPRAPTSAIAPVISALVLGLLYLSHPTLAARVSTSGPCQKPTYAPQQTKARHGPGCDVTSFGGLCVASFAFKQESDAYKPEENLPQHGIASPSHDGFLQIPYPTVARSKQGFIDWPTGCVGDAASAFTSSGYAVACALVRCVPQH